VKKLAAEPVTCR